MPWWKRGIRVARIALLVLAGSALVLYAAGIPGVWWFTPWRLVLLARSGTLAVQWHGAGTIVTRPSAGAGLGGPSAFPLGIRSSVSVQTSDRWLWTTSVMHDTLPPGGPPLPGSYSVYVRIRLLRLAMIAGALGGGLLFIRAKGHPRGACPACGYDLSGLADGSACPECGGAPANEELEAPLPPDARSLSAFRPMPSPGTTRFLPPRP